MTVKPAQFEPIPDVTDDPVTAETHTEKLMALARKHGPIFWYVDRLHISGLDLVSELCDTSRFDKATAIFPEVNEYVLGCPGLLTRETPDPAWHKSHNILMPNFSVKAMKNYHPMMAQIAANLIAKWDSACDSGNEVDVGEDMTRLTFDTIGLCGFGADFKSFEMSDAHPFINAMVGSLSDTLPPRPDRSTDEKRRLDAHAEHMHSLVDTIIRERKASGARKSDLLDCMLYSTDASSGQKLDDIQIRAECITFLIAGHETTSGLLTFAMYFLLKNPDVLRRAHDEVDRVFGADVDAMPTLEQVRGLRYIEQILNESLRVWPTIPVFGVAPMEDTVLGGKYRIEKGTMCDIIVPVLHCDRRVWGDDAESFNPDHFAETAAKDRHPNAFLPFGNGVRACIGRQFAMQEAKLVLGLLLQRYKFTDRHSYQLHMSELIGTKPKDLRILLERRSDGDRRHAPTVTVATAAPTTASTVGAMTLTTGHNTPLHVLYGSNMGSSEELAERIFTDAKARGFSATLATLDANVGKLPADGAVVIVCSSYNGMPPDNAVKFCNWLQEDHHTASSFSNLKYSLFGCGNREWASTYQSVPRLIDDRLRAWGAERVHEVGAADASDDFDGDFEKWYRPFWDRLGEALGVAVSASETAAADTWEPFDLEMMEDQHPSPFAAAFNAKPMTVIVNQELQVAGGGRSTRHIEVALPEGVHYVTGDHLGVIPHNDAALVARVASRFDLDPRTRIRLRNRASIKTSLPMDSIVSVSYLLTAYVELQEVATRRQITALAHYTPCPPDKRALLALSGDDEASAARYRDHVLSKGRSILHLLEEFPACQLPFHVYLALLSPLRPRYYSISSSPRQYERICSITVGVLEAPARDGQSTFRGVCSNYLRNRRKGEPVFAFVRDTHSPFRLPRNPATPIIMIGPGTGLAPFRGFLQERAAQKAAGRSPGPSLLFFGCRHPRQDFIYQEELEDFAREGIAELFVAFSRPDEGKKAYVQDKIWENRDRVWQLLEDGAVIYICGDASRMAVDVRKTFLALYCEKTSRSESDGLQWLADKDEANLYLTDVWAST